MLRKNRIKNTYLFKIAKRIGIISILSRLILLFKILSYQTKKATIWSSAGDPEVLSIEETLAKIRKNKLSVSRFGDGEFRWMSNIPNEDSFQKSSKELAFRLQQVMNSKNNNLLVCIPNVFKTLKYYTNTNRFDWTKLLNQYYLKWLSLIDTNKVFGDANFSRLYIDRKDKTNSKKYFDETKMIWNDIEVVIVEGHDTRFGVGNDLLINAKKIKRIICPTTDAFDKYGDILKECVKEKEQADLFLVALGPTATVLCSDLCDLGEWAIDIGHLDVEYEWYRSGAKKRIPIKGKYVNELPDNGRDVENLSDNKYLSEIISTVL